MDLQCKFLASVLIVLHLMSVSTLIAGETHGGNEIHKEKVPVIIVTSIKTVVVDENSGETAVVEHVDEIGNINTLGKGGIEKWTLPYHLTNQLTKTKMHSVQIECTSDTDLIQWNYNGSGILPSVQIENSRFAADYWNSSTYRYTSRITLSSFTEQLTGLYICQTVGNSSVQNSFQLFSPRESYQPFEEGSVILTTKQEIIHSEIFPCRISNLSTVFILQERNYENDLQIVEFSESIKFDPYVGFRVHDSEYVSRFIENESRYFCVDVATGRIVLEIKLQEVVNGNTDEDYADNEEKAETPSMFSVAKEGNSHVFTCRSNISAVPNIIFEPYHNSQEGCLPSNVKPYLMGINPIWVVEDTAPFQIEEECGEGCRKIKTNLKSVTAKCIEIGLNHVLRIPSSSYCVERPFLIQRGEELSIYVAKKQKKVIIPCIANSQSASIYLYRESVKKNRQPTLMDKESFTYDPLYGFSLNTTILPYPCGTYICTSNIDLNDTSDSVKVHIHPKPVGEFEPKESSVYGLCPKKFKWRSKEQLIVRERKMGVSSFRYDFSHLFTYPFVGTFELLYPRLDVGEINLIRRRNGKLAHTWKYNCIENETVLASGISASTVYDISGDVGLTYISIKCQSKSSIKPQVITTAYCSNDNSCSLSRQNSDRIINFPNSRPHLDTHEQQSCGTGCTSIQFLAEARPEFPFRQVVCYGEGVDLDKQFATINLFASGSNAMWNPDLENETPVLSINTQNDIDRPWEQHSNLQWDLEETVSFECKSVTKGRHMISRHFMWAIQYENGTMEFKEGEDEEDDGNGIVGRIDLELDDVLIKRLWCFAPLHRSRAAWINASYPIFIKNSNDDLNCDSKGLEMRLVRLYPLPQNGISLQDNRLDALKYFVVPPQITNMDIEVVSSEPIVWTFSSYWNRHTFTFKNEQTPRSTLELFQNEISSYCYTSKLRLEMDIWKIPRSFNTGLLSVFYVHQPWKKSSIYLYFPGNDDKFLLNSGTTLSLPISRDSLTVLPCIVNDPTAVVNLYKKNDGGLYEKFDSENAAYDPKVGFKIQTNLTNSSNSTEVYKCITNSKSFDEIEIRLFS